MGLDMYAYAVNKKLMGDSEIDINTDTLITKAKANGIKGEPNDVNTDFDYWRKFNNLHGWMERLYRSKGGTKEFNCVGVVVNAEDLKKLREDAATLEPTSGFFFGQCSPMTAEDVQEVNAFCDKAEKAIADGYVIVYDSWW